MAAEPKPITVHITFKTILQIVALLGFLVFLYVMRDLVLIILVSVVIASAIEPAAVWLKRYRVTRLPAVIIIYSITLGILFTIVPFSIFYLLGDLTDLLTSLQQMFTGLLPGSEAPPQTIKILGSLVPGLSWDDILQNLRVTLVGIQGGFLPTASLIFGGLLSFMLIIVLSFYLSVQERGVENFLRAVMPISVENYVVDLWQRAQNKIGRWLQGQLVLAVLVGVLVYLGLTILGIEHALTLGFVAAVLELIPLFGPVLAAVPAVLVALSGGITDVLMVVGLYLIIQQFENHLLQPLVVNKIIGVPPILVIIALVIGAKLAGFLGIILAAPVSAVLIEVFDDWEKRKSLFKQRAHGA